MAQETKRVSTIAAATRLEQVRYAIRDMVVLAEELEREGKKILPLNIGDPLKFDFCTPPHLIEAVARAMKDGKNGYAPSLGVPEALEAIHAEAERKGIRNIQSVFITQGATEAVEVCLTALVNPDENLLTPSPEYPLYSAVLAKLGVQPNVYQLDEDDGWAPHLDQVRGRIFAGTRGMLIINPNNPTGAVYDRSTLEALAELARQNNLVIISDEIYEKLILDDQPQVSIASLAPDVPVVTLGGLSKAYLVPGWRLGWAVISGDAKAVKPYVEGVHKLLRARLSANHPEQFAVRPAVEGPQDHLAEVISRLRARRDLTANWCNSTPHVSCVKPRGAFYAFPRLDIPETDEAFAKRLLREKQVLVVHGSGFGQVEGTRHFRVVFLPDEPTLTSAYGRIREFLDEHYL